MATIIVAAVNQAKGEKRQWDFDFNPDLPSGVTVSSAVATHVPPSGTPATPTVGAQVAGIVPVTIGPLTVEGWHSLDCEATYSNGNESIIRLMFNVTF